MSVKPVPTDILEEVAAETEWPVDRLEKAAEQLNSAVLQRLPEHYDESRLASGPDYILQESHNETWLAMDPYDIDEDLNKAGVDMDPSLQRAVAIAHLEHCQAYGSTISVPIQIASQIEDPVFYPIRVEKTEAWKRAEFHMLQLFQAFVSRQQMTGSEALDYWVTTHFDQSVMDWSGYRDVGREAIRKNVRQAEDKIEEHGHGTGYDANDIRFESLDEVSEHGVFDEEERRFYTPRREDVDEMRERLHSDE